MKSPRILLALAVLTLALAGCLRVYKIDVQQGNDLSEKQLSALEVGMDRQAVRALLGTPLLDDPFRQDRWDYFYAFKPGRSKEVTRRQVSLFFDGDRLARVEGGLEEETVRANAVDVEEMIKAEREAREAEEDARRAEQPGFWDRVSTAVRRIEGEE